MVPPTRTTRSGTASSRRGLDVVARHVVRPTGISSSQWPSVRDTLRNLGLGFDPWQQDLGRLCVAKRKDGTYAATVGGVVISIPRQVGKTFTVGGLVFALCMLRPGIKVVWTSHHLSTTDETFEDMSAMARMPRIAHHILTVRSGNGKQRIKFRNRSQIEFGARESGFGRGKKQISILILDEFQHVSEAALENLVPAMNQGDNPLLFMMGTPPRPIDRGEAFKNRRRDALSGKSTDMVYVEIGADPDAKLDDRKQWAKANPSFPRRTPASSILRMRANLASDDSFKREALGIWDDDSVGSRLISADLWSKTGVAEAPEGLVSFGVAFSPDGSRVGLGGCRKHDGGLHVELLDAFSGRLESGIAALAKWLADRRAATAQITIAGAAGAGTLRQDLRDLGVPERMIVVATTQQYTTGCAMLHEGLIDGSVTHLASDGQKVLDDSVAVCDRKTRGGGWGWMATTPDGDEVPLEAVSVALFGARTTKRNPDRKTRAVVM